MARRIIDGPPDSGAPLSPIAMRLAWFFAIAFGSALATAVVAYGLEALVPR
jgi:hypothetical protein